MGHEKEDTLQGTSKGEELQRVWNVKKEVKIKEKKGGGTIEGGRILRWNLKGKRRAGTLKRGGSFTDIKMRWNVNRRWNIKTRWNIKRRLKKKKQRGNH